ncbi:glutathione S-transferase [Congregibacter sp.]|uniref:glutathione S-transferase n=1 Tax=Congregibacter sp. TaxID=2744308 RepID=UPI003F6C39A2
MSVQGPSGLPLLYSFRRCPYAIRARMTLAYAGVKVELREVLLKDKPAAMLAASEKGTVPVLVLPGGRVIDESIDVMRWALEQADPQDWLTTDLLEDRDDLLSENDGAFKSLLDRYKYADRYPEHSAQWYRDQANGFLVKLDLRLEKTAWLAGAEKGFVDVAIFPFIRQFAGVDRGWFDQSPYPHLRCWLDTHLDSPLFKAVMQKYPRWTPEQAGVILPELP